jgi:hypothetical protein
MSNSFFNLANLNGLNGFTINGINPDDFSGRSVSSAGDVNNDGIDDLIIGASGADPNGNGRAGQSYVVFGRNNGFAPSFNLSGLDGTNGFAINGIKADDFSGRSVSNAGDINGDGIDDLIVGASNADFDEYAGQNYVVFGRSTGFNPSFNLSGLDGTNGFAINGIDAFGSVSNAGDINNDGIDDLIIGSPEFFPDNSAGAGQSYVVFGSNSGFAPSFNVSGLNGTNGFAINGINPDNYINPDEFPSYSVSSAGDINGDGIDDLIIGSAEADPEGLSRSGQSYVVFGRSTGFDPSLNLSDLNGTNGFAINGIDAFDNSGDSVSSAGDVNGDGLDDLIIGAPFADPDGLSFSWSGQSYVIYGNTAPQLDINGTGTGINNTTTFSGNPIIASRQLTLTDNVNTITGATVNIVNPLNGAFESLTANVAGTNVTAAYNSNTGTLTLTGNIPLLTIKEFSAALLTIIILSIPV